MSKPEQKRFPEDVVQIVRDLLSHHVRNTLQDCLKSKTRAEYDATVNYAKPFIFDKAYSAHLQELKAEANAKLVLDEVRQKSIKF